jgi:hypothetical protein
MGIQRQRQFTDDKEVARAGGGQGGSQPPRQVVLHDVSATRALARAVTR